MIVPAPRRHAAGHCQHVIPAPTHWQHDVTNWPNRETAHCEIVRFPRVWHRPIPRAWNLHQLGSYIFSPRDFSQRNLNMPTLMELQSRLSTRRDGHASPTNTAESLISDARGQLTPAQTVELKLHGLLERPK